jgi:uncharacterized protein with PIN domain
MEQGKVPQFVVDAMLGRLARWLRILGFDTWYFREIDDQHLLRLHAETGRVLLTRDTKLVGCRGIGVHVLVKSDRWEDQLREVVKTLSLILYQERLLTRCLLCNRLLNRLSPEEAYGRIPDHVARSTSDFRGCESCGKVFWPGTHRRHITEVVTRLGYGQA